MFHFFGSSQLNLNQILIRLAKFYLPGGLDALKIFCEKQVAIVDQIFFIFKKAGFTVCQIANYLLHPFSIWLVLLPTISTFPDLCQLTCLIPKSETGKLQRKF